MGKQIKILLSEPDLFFTLLIAPFIVLLIIFISPIIKIRIGHIHCDRIGHFAMNTELCVLEKKYLSKNNNSKQIDIMYLPRKPSCNYTLEQLWKRKLNILPRFILRPVSLIIRSFPILESFNAKSINGDRDVLNLIDLFGPTLEFTKEENQLGMKYLQDFGLGRDSKYVCIMCRDSSYLNSFYGSDFRTHDYRNSDINNFLEVAEELTKLGYFVFRMGSIANEPFNTSNKKIIDYPFSEKKSDFLDIFISANCHFCITTGLGLDAIPNIFRKPIVYVNFAPLETIHTTSENYIILPKYYYNKKLGRKMTLSEIMDSDAFGALKSDIFESLNIRLIENSPDEIKYSALEMHHYIGNSKRNIFNQRIQDDFWTTFMKHPKINKKLYGLRKSLISENFIKNNSWWLN